MSEFDAVDILLVEDDPTDAEVMLRALRKANLARAVLWVKDGAEALEYLFSTGKYLGRGNAPPRLVLLDIKMPKVDGIEVLRQLRERDPNRGITVVMLTSSAEDRDIEQTYALGVNSYVVKPVDFETLLDEVARLGFYWLVMNKVPHRAAPGLRLE
jgi:two-component system response regulator